MAFSDSGEEDVSSAGFGLVTAALLFLAVILAVITLPSAVAWEEQLEACRVRGITPSQCPDDDSYVGIPYNPPAPVLNDSSAPGGVVVVRRGVSSSEGFGSSRLWVLSGYKQVDERVVCYTGYERRVFRHRGWTTYKDNKEVTVSGCVDFLIQKPINLVLASRWYQ